MSIVIRICAGDECVAYLYPNAPTAQWLDPHGGVFDKEQEYQLTKLANEGGGEHISLVNSRRRFPRLSVRIVF